MPISFSSDITISAPTSYSAISDKASCTVCSGEMGRILLNVLFLSTWSTVSVIFIGSSMGLSQGYAACSPWSPGAVAVEEKYTLDCIPLSYPPL